MENLWLQGAVYIKDFGLGTPIKQFTYWVMLGQSKMKVKLDHFFPSQQKGW